MWYIFNQNELNAIGLYNYAIYTLSFGVGVFFTAFLFLINMDYHKAAWGSFIIMIVTVVVELTMLWMRNGYIQTIKKESINEER